MHLKEYLKKNLMTPNEFAEKSGIHRTTVYGYLRGIPARLSFAYRIEKFTNGEVTAQEMIE